MSDRDHLLASMYDDDDLGHVPAPPIEPTGTRKIRVGVIEYEVPTVEYVRHLERRLTMQTEQIAQQQRALRRIESMLHGTRSFVRRYGEAISDLRLDLSRKVDQS